MTGAHALPATALQTVIDQPRPQGRSPPRRSQLHTTHTPWADHLPFTHSRTWQGATA
ncbi:hypothetical protein ACFPFX_04415 [Streptomyces mauvecolor]|uniref:Uncharacterized protein n=1 Tax=Streptomyces mauvecolor TaxID=58345 RepID=A0ABV9UGC4_9ACTN